jgi:hypothetical protein
LQQIVIQTQSQIGRDCSHLKHRISVAWIPGESAERPFAQPRPAEKYSSQVVSVGCHTSA